MRSCDSKGCVPYHGRRRTAARRLIFRLSGLVRKVERAVGQGAMTTERMAMTGMAGLMTRMAGGSFWLAACALAAIFVGPGVATAQPPASSILGSPTAINSRTLLLGSSADGLGTLVSPLVGGSCTEAPSIETQP